MFKMKKVPSKSIKRRFWESFCNRLQLIVISKTSAFSKARLLPLSKRSKSSEAQITAPLDVASENPCI
jgi:hypothetical protein